MNEPISILVPTYNRNRFLSLFVRNLKVQDYPHNLITVIIDDDGTEPFIPDNILKEVTEDISPMKLIYKKSNHKRTIGKKRNDLVKSATTKIVAFMDDDDIYMPSYLSYSYETLKDKKVGCVGSAQMIFTMSQNDYTVYAIDCGNHKNLIHEATLMMTKKWFRASCGFENSSIGEGKTIFVGMENNVALTDVIKCMICLQHSGNTVDKLQFAKDECKIDITIKDSLKTILTDILK
jgi:glycosyltransferase involved in cell wall biosynthesis